MPPRRKGKRGKAATAKTAVVPAPEDEPGTNLDDGYVEHASRSPNVPEEAAEQQVSPSLASRAGSDHGLSEQPMDPFEDDIEDNHDLFAPGHIVDDDNDDDITPRGRLTFRLPARVISGSGSLLQVSDDDNSDEAENKDMDEDEEEASEADASPSRLSLSPRTAAAGAPIDSALQDALFSPVSEVSPMKPATKRASAASDTPARKRHARCDSGKKNASKSTSESPTRRIAIKRPRGRPRKQRSPSLEEVIPDTISISCYMEVSQPDQMVKGKTVRGNKSVKQAPFQFPAILDITTSWDLFLDLVAMTVRAPRINLLMATFRWAFSKNAAKRSSALPLSNQLSYEMLIRQLTNFGAKVCGTITLFVMMDPPKKQESLPWDSVEGSSRAPVDSTTGELPYDLDDLIGAKTSVDNKLEPIADDLRSTYRIGLCARHPTIACFHYRNKDWHFNLDDNLINIWAHAILRKQATPQLPPLGNKAFRIDSTIGYQRHGNAHSIDHAGPSVPATPHSAYGAQMFPVPLTPTAYNVPHPQGPYPYAMPPPYGYPMPAPAVMHMPTAHSTIPSSGPPSSPMLPAIARTADVSEWCKNVGLGANIAEYLVDGLGFQVGDKVSNIDKDDWKAAGFKPLEWARFVKAYKEYKDSVNSRMV